MKRSEGDRNSGVIWEDKEGRKTMVL